MIDKFPPFSAFANSSSGLDILLFPDGEWQFREDVVGEISSDDYEILYESSPQWCKFVSSCDLSFSDRYGLLSYNLSFHSISCIIRMIVFRDNKG